MPGTENGSSTAAIAIFIHEHRGEVSGDVPGVRRQRAHEPHREVVERHIVIASDDNLGTRQLPKKGASLREFASAGALGGSPDTATRCGAIVVMARTSGATSRGSARPKCKSDKWTTVRITSQRR
jgi:hypothetical protein